jgi:uncharacterized protein
MKRRHFLIAAVLCFPQRVLAAKRNPAQKLITAAESQIGVTVSYDPGYVKLPYPNGDVPVERGVCTDVVIRAYRTAFGIDLQKLVHEDMAKNFSSYPQIWGLKNTDRNIDHRRVPNLQRFFKRKQAELTGVDYQPGDIVTMMVAKTLPHIAIVSATMNDTGDRPLLIHNIGAGTKREDILGTFPVTGHYRYLPA